MLCLTYYYDQGKILHILESSAVYMCMYVYIYIYTHIYDNKTQEPILKHLNRIIFKESCI